MMSNRQLLCGAILGMAGMFVLAWGGSYENMGSVPNYSGSEAVVNR